MNLQKIEILNFLSFENTTYEFPKNNGLYVIEGVNLDTGGSNGAGKSSLFEAVYFALTGKTIRKTNEAGLIHNKASSQCKVTLWFTHNNKNYVIERGRRPSFLDISENSNSITKQNALETQEFINNLFRFDYKSLLASMIYGQHSGMNFLSASPEDKRKILNSYLSLEKIFEYRSCATEGKKELSTKVAFFETKLKELSSELEKYSFKEPIAKPEYCLDEIMSLDRELAIFKLEAEKLKRDIDKLELNIKKHISNKDSCFNCGKPYETKEELEKEKLLIDSLLKELEEKKTSLEYCQNRIRNSKLPITPSELNKKYEEYNRFLISNERKQLLEEDLNAIKEELKDSKQKLESFQFWQKAFSETGIVRYIIRGILNKFNKIVSDNLKTLTNGHYDIVFDDKLEETIFNNGSITFYDSLSGGEKNKVDISVLIALQQLPSIVGNVDINVILFDEVGGFLDEEGLDLLYILLQKLSKDKVVFIISHNEKLKKIVKDYPKVVVQKSLGVSNIIS